MNKKSIPVFAVPKMLVSALLLSALVPLFAPPAISATSEQETLVLHQKFRGGQAICYVNSHAVKVDMTGSGCYLIAKAPTWRIVVLNKKDNLALEKTYDDFLKTFHKGSGVFHSELVDRLCIPIGKRMYLGHECDCYILGALKNQPVKTVTNDKTKSIAKSPDRNSRDEVNRNNEYFALPAVGVPNQPAQIIQQLMGLPHVAGIPVMFRVKTRIILITGHAEDVSNAALATSQIEHVHCANAFFDYPTNFKVTKSEEDVMFNSGMKKNVEDAFGDLGIGTDFGTAKK